MTFSAENLAKALDELGLKYMVPGDQDFSAGISFLNKIAHQSKFKFLISNLKDKKILKSQPWDLVEGENLKLFLIGIIDPKVINDPNIRKNFLPVTQSLKKVIGEIKKNGFDEKNNNHRLILLSHSGIDTDQKLAQAFPMIDWIFGAHTQSFYRNSYDVGNVRIGQVLSRNHYLGEVTISSGKETSHDQYQIHEIRDELKDQLKPNPFLAFIDRHKFKMKEYQLKEQDEILSQFQGSEGPKKMMTALSCLECHDQQGEHWMKTPHALAYVTLVNANEETNLTCLKCHSVGLGDTKRGFLKSMDFIAINENETEKEKLKKSFVSAFRKLAKPISSVRKLTPQELKSFSDKILELEKKYKVEHNFSSVQCLNCHSRHPDHPFESEKIRNSMKLNTKEMKKRCLTCHDPDQSPSWYLKGHGPNKDPNWKVIDPLFKKFSCPKSE